MPLGPMITPEVRHTIAKIYMEHSNWKIKQIRLEADLQLHKRDPDLKKGFPSLGTVEKTMAKIRKKMPSTTEEGPWGLETLNDEPIPPESLPAVLDAWAYCRVDENQEFTVRMAKWAAKFYKIYEIGGRTDKTKKLVDIAKYYAKTELTSKLADVSFNHAIYTIDLYQDLLEQRNEPRILNDAFTESLLSEKENSYLREAQRLAKVSGNSRKSLSQLRLLNNKF